MTAVPRFNRPLSEQVTRYTRHLADLEYARTSDHAKDVWRAADRDRDVERITDGQHAIVAGRAEELIATLPAAAVIPAQRTREVTHG